MLKLGDLVTFISKDDWIEYGSKGLVSHINRDMAYQDCYRIKFHTGNAADKDILCEGVDLELYSPTMSIVLTPNTVMFDSWIKDTRDQYSDKELELLEFAFYSGVNHGRKK